jgi:methionyl-tRNA formyltransferase
MRIAYIGTSSFAVAPLKALAASGFEICAVVAQPDRPSSRRGLKTQIGPVTAEALSLGISVLQPESIKESAAELASLDCDLAVVCAYGQMLSLPVIGAFKLGAINIHASLLPKYRGAAPIHRAIMNAEASTGITIMQLEKGLDTGAILYTASMPIGEDDTASSLGSELSLLGADAVCETINNYAALHRSRTLQDGSKAVYAEKIQKHERFVGFCEGLSQTHNRIRGLDRDPGAYALLDGKRISLYGSHIAASGGVAGADGEMLGTQGKALLIACGGGALSIGSVKAQGKRELSGKEFFSGARHKFLQNTNNTM